MFEGLFQPMHLLVLFGIALLVLGPKKLPEFAGLIRRWRRRTRSRRLARKHRSPGTDLLIATV
jgi:Sec-independent protein translocase protein TatA